MWELDHKENWALKNWCFQTAVLEKTLDIPWTARRSNQSILKDHPWIFIGRTDSEAEAPILWPSDARRQLIGKDPDAGKDWGQADKGVAENEVVGWHHQLNGHGFEETPGDSEDKEAWCAAVQGVTKCPMWQSVWTVTIFPKFLLLPSSILWSNRCLHYFVIK